ncbi:MAG: hypothetical protein AAFQ45_09905 [Pseudomonadota bacterium]
MQSATAPVPGAMAGTILITAALALGSALPTAASDYQHSCRTADGSYFMNDGTLFEATNDGDQSSPIPFKAGTKTIITRRAGYCLASLGGARKRYSFSFERYLLDATFRMNGDPVQAVFLCEEASDGLPAAARCEVERVTDTYKASLTEPPPPATGNDGAPEARTGDWMHNGSAMRLVASGAERSFVYQRPRNGLKSVGVKPGTLLFEGRRTGGRYLGTAYVFTRNCGPKPFDVSGEVSEDQTQVTLYGERPRYNRACKRIGTREETLIFRLGG